MGKSKAQGTAWESALVKLAVGSYDMEAYRLAEGGSNDIADVWLETKLSPLYDPITVLAWKRLVQNGGKRRVPDGEPEVVVLTVQDFLLLLSEAKLNAYVECKATERLNPTRVLAKARAKVARNG